MAHGIATVIAIGAGGAVGALARWSTGLLVSHLTRWPEWAGTLTANVIGCFSIGMAWSWLEARDHEEWVRGLLITGLLGAFTTFSTFSLDAMHLVHDRHWGELVVYVGGSVVVGLIAVKLGMWVVG